MASHYFDIQSHRDEARRRARMNEPPSEAHDPSEIPETRARSWPLVGGLLALGTAVLVAALVFTNAARAPVLADTPALVPERHFELNADDLHALGASSAQAQSVPSGDSSAPAQSVPSSDSSAPTAAFATPTSAPTAAPAIPGDANDPYATTTGESRRNVSDNPYGTVLDAPRPKSSDNPYEPVAREPRDAASEDNPY